MDALDKHVTKSIELTYADTIPSNGYDTIMICLNWNRDSIVFDTIDVDSLIITTTYHFKGGESTVNPLLDDVKLTIDSSNTYYNKIIKFEYVLCSDCSTPTVTSTVVVKAPENVMYKIGVRSYIYLAVEVRLN